MSATSPIDIQQILNTAGKIQPKISRLMMQSIKTILAGLSPEYDVQNTRDLLTFEEGNIMQPYDANLTTAKDLGVIDKRTLTVDVGMLYIADEIERYRSTYLVTLEELDLTSAKLPFANWYLETITQVGLQDLYKLPWQGVKAVGTDPEDITDGYLQIIADEITATNISVANGNLYTLTGAAVDYTSSTIGDELKGQFELFPELTQERGVVCHIPYRYKSMYKEWFKSEYPNITDGNVDTEYLDGTDRKCKFNWTSAIGTSKRVTMTTSDNLKYGIDKMNKEFGKIVVFNPNNNPFLLAAVNKIVIGFQIRTLNSREFNCNNLA